VGIPGVVRKQNLRPTGGRARIESQKRSSPYDTMVQQLAIRRPKFELVVYQKYSGAS
jgi:hypothetical protein